MNEFLKKLQNPPKKYRPIPFWSWNDKLEVSETKAQIREMDKAGLGGFFMHARGGLQTEYLSDEWFLNVSASIDEGKKSGMLAFGYDENGWPSGFGNGAVNGLGLEYQQKYLRCSEVESPVKDEYTISNVKTDEKIYHCYFDVNPYYVDTLNADATKEFLKSTHEKYREVLGDEFKNMKGFFTDEPQASRNGIPWSFNLQKEYEKIYGEPIEQHLPKLFYRIDGFAEFRFRYWQLVRDLFADNFMCVIGKWCKENDSKLTGHAVLEEYFYEHILANGCCMPLYEFMDIPGMDHLCRGLPSVQTEMQLTSVANQLGKKQILSETFPACGWNVSFEDLRKLYEHQMVHGVNLLCQHLEAYSLRGIRKRDYPASLFKHQPWWNDYKTFNDMVSRIGLLISEGEVNFNILVLHTIESGWLVSDDRNEADLYAEKMLGVMNALENSQLQYHLGDSRIIKRHGKIENGKFIIGTQSYSVVIVPPAKCLDKNTFDMLKKFKNQGGTVIFTEEIPEYINGIKDSSVLDFANNCIITSGENIAEKIPETNRLISVSTDKSGEEQNIRSTVRYFKDKKMTVYYLCNFGEKDINVTVNVNGKSAEIFDAVSGKTKPVCFENSGEKVIIKSKIHSNSSVIFFVYDEEICNSEKPESIQKVSISDKLKGEWQVLNSDSNSLTLDYCDLFADKKPISKNIPVSDVQEILCAYGKKVNADIVFHFNINELSFNNCELMLETPEIFDIFVNETKVDKIITGNKYDTCFKTIDIFKYLKKGKNEICLSCEFEQSKEVYKKLEDVKYFESLKNNLTYDMEIEAVYLIGDFGVFTKNRFEILERNAIRTKGGFYLDKAPKTVSVGSLEEQGYPFFAGSITLNKKINLSAQEAKKAVIDFEKLPSIITDICVNGNSAGKIMWKPYRIGISKLLNEGENEITVTLTSSLRNLLGPFHLDEGETHTALPFYFFHKSEIWGWGDGINHKWVDDYSFVQNGIFLK